MSPQQQEQFNILDQVSSLAHVPRASHAAAVAALNFVRAELERLNQVEEDYSILKTQNTAALVDASIERNIG